MDRRTDGPAKGCERERDVAVHRRARCSPIGDYTRTRHYWGAARVVARGGAMPIGGLQPASCRLLFRRVGSARRSMRVANHRLDDVQPPAPTNSQPWIELDARSSLDFFVSIEIVL